VCGGGCGVSSSSSSTSSSSASSSGGTSCGAKGEVCCFGVCHAGLLCDKTTHKCQ
jgi:hypothetical protein